MKSIPFIIPFLLLVLSVHAQHCTTNTTPGSTINEFDWTVQQYNDIWIVNTNNPAAGAIEVFPLSPFYYDDEDQNIDHLSTAINKDFLSEDGWELVSKKFGSSGASANGVTIPSFVLYNRYEAQLSAFFYIPESLVAANGFNKAKIILKFISTDPNKQSSLLAPAQTPIKALDNFEKNLTMVAPNFYDNGGDYWLHATFPVYYDPCTCDHFTRIIIDPELLDVQDIELKMTGGGIIKPIVSSGTPQNNSFSSTINDINKVITSGTKIAKNLEGFRTFAQDVTSVFNAVDIATSSQPLTEAGKIAHSEKLNSAFKFPEWTKTIPKVGIFIGIAEYFAGGGKSTASPKPSSFEADFNFTISGNKTTTNPFQGINIFVPGSDWINNATTFPPIYDNTLGVFSLLETPQINFEIEEREFNIPDPDDQNQTTQDAPFAIHYQMQNSLKYAINPASGLNQVPVDIKAALVFEGCEPSSYDLVESSPLLVLYTDSIVRHQTPFIPLSCFNDYVAYLQNDTDFPSLDQALCDDLKVYVKVMATLERDPSDVFYDPDAEKVLFMADYETTLTEAPITETYPELNDIQINESVDNLSLSEDQTIYAWSTIEVGQNIETNGNQLTLIAGTEIISELSDIDPNIDLIIGTPTPCEGNLPAQTAQEVSDFCSIGGYDPLASLNFIDEKSNDQNLKIDLKLLVSPNPFNNYVDLKYSNDLSKNAQIIVTDAMGREVTNYNTELNKTQTLRLQTSNWLSGFYLITLKTENDVKTVKVIKQ
ncbi:MAG: hypothetical protein ACI8YQ_002277 [Polaribacter sp.]|jgi:hypothetical protein